MEVRVFHLFIQIKIKYKMCLWEPVVRSSSEIRWSARRRGLNKYRGGAPESADLHTGILIGRLRFFEMPQDSIILYSRTVRRVRGFGAYICSISKYLYAFQIWIGRPYLSISWKVKSKCTLGLSQTVDPLWQPKIPSQPFFCSKPVCTIQVSSLQGADDCCKSQNKFCWQETSCSLISNCFKGSAQPWHHCLHCLSRGKGSESRTKREEMGG